MLRATPSPSAPRSRRQPGAHQNSRACTALCDTATAGTVVWNPWKPPAQMSSSALPPASPIPLANALLGQRSVDGELPRQSPRSAAGDTRNPAVWERLVVNALWSERRPTSRLGPFRQLRERSVA
jgi:hypothetical protein